jgi:KaiC/GvpD/RAD55 family RecA-like ATPase
MVDDLARTGIDGLDKVLGGGIPRGRYILLVGGPGTGKTTLSLQFLYNGAVEYGENGLYVTMQESPTHIRKDLLKFGLDFEILEDEDRLRIVDYSASTYLSSLTRMIGIASEEYSKAEKDEEIASKFDNLIKSIKEEAKTIDAKRIVLDPITGLVFQEPDPVKRTMSTRQVFQILEETGCTSLIVSESKATNIDHEFQMEEYFAHGVILLQNFSERGTNVRGLTVEKMRGVAHDLQPHPYQIGPKGIVVFPGEKIFSGMH